MKKLIIITIILLSHHSFAGSSDSFERLNFYTDMTHFVFGGDLKINLVKARSVEASSLQQSNTASGSTTQNFGGISGIQTSSTGYKKHKVVTYTNSNSKVIAIAEQNTTDGSNQNCAATKCIQIME